MLADGEVLVVGLSISHLSKKFGEFIGVDNVSIDIKDGEFLTLLGPSGCGKSTTLAAIAGLDRPTSGRIVAGERVCFDSSSNTYLAAEHRNFGLVFQSYALWPHMTVAGNIAFPLELRKVAKAEIHRRVEEVLDLVELSDMGARYPHQLSGGQQQRVALARTLVYRPSVLLLDEPLSNLDAKLRERARFWLRQVQEKVRLTTIYVTHDQAEALAMSDRIAVMSKGRIEQLGTPHEIYDNPATPVIAEFIGTNSFLSARVSRSSETGEGEVVLDNGSTLAVSLQGNLIAGSAVTVTIRPERVTLLRPHDAVPAERGETLKGQIVGRTYLGAKTQYDVSLGGGDIRVETHLEEQSGEASLWIPSHACSVFERRNALHG
ncbi:MAG: ABC transporter ATP-binding protein [Phyllobacterium sp.]